MSKKEGYSRKGLFGEIKHYDASGHKIGESRPKLFSGWNNYDAYGNKTGESYNKLLGGLNLHQENSRWLVCFLRLAVKLTCAMLFAMLSVWVGVLPFP